ncbi:MAG: TetR/AcrR family transcriptional regulator [Acidobacteriota bacterium]|nr:TetR/AcrR family transcriptional regulator [Acidobacteriota bacterium]
MQVVQEHGPSRQKTSRRETRTTQIYEAAARVFCEHGFGQSSMSDVAAAVDMTKAGIYHHIASKDELLFGIMSYGMDIFEERVLDRVENISDPLERLRATIRGHLLLVTRDRTKEVTVVLNEAHALHGDYRTRINRRKRRYVRFLNETFRELQRKRLVREIEPRVATFALLGMINWTYHWYTANGRLRDTEVAEAYIDLFLGGLLNPDQATCSENDPS